MGWLLVMFDLPVTTKKERRVATKFRNDLLDSGYMMLQYSVYVRCAVTLDKREGLITELKKFNPKTGNVHCLFVTDAQWRHGIVIHAGEATKGERTISKDSQVGEQLQFW